MKPLALALSTAFMVVSMAAFVGWFDPDPWEYGLVALAAAVLCGFLGIFVADKWEER